MINYFKIICLTLVFVLVFGSMAFAEATTDTTAVTTQETDSLDNPADVAADTLNDILDDINADQYNSTNYDLLADFYNKNNEKGIKVFCYGAPIDFSKYNNVLPQLVNDRTLVPIRALAESMGAVVDFENGVITITLNGKEIQLTLNSNIAEVDGEQVTLDVPAKTINDRTMIPLRFVSQNFGKKVGWHAAGAASVISITD